MDERPADGRTPQERRPDASMTLLTSMLERPLDPSYQAAADRRRAAGETPATSSRTVLVFVMMLLTGLLFAIGAQALRPKPTAAATVRDELVSRIETLQTHSTAQEATLAALSKQVRDLEDLSLQQSGSDDLTAQIKQLEVGAAAVPLRGSGLTLTIDDAASADADANAGNRPSGGFQQGRVTSGDLQIVVNGLWGAGAEAIAINGHRLSSTAAIRFAGQAIIVDFRPLSRPYVITALGDPQGMQQIFEPSFAGVYLDQLRQEYQIRSSIATSDDLTVPGDTSAKLDHAKPLSGTVGSAPSLTSTQTGSGSGTGSEGATSAPSSPASGSTPNPQETTQ
ncbi:uncharacterized protein YlxW (UPF0749 family) [Humibacillus xanthopallidus]|uniref:Uncharacterized protein YlxW (UPF0749 family) n=1 Tax=Humibacillus xanthopallidus TaxID=412689 RepID=A0A543PUY0_9MICO|nr:DUF881 domain-containing protein [Humibacillus xanthopallidus]TQN47885.1 uncharacterized protein YlxW (UPF0749 family) [Humibacillus xanthopallidus]